MKNRNALKQNIRMNVNVEHNAVSECFMCLIISKHDLHCIL